MRFPFAQRAGNKFIWGASQLVYRRPLTIVAGAPLISFTFDDFPRTATAQRGGNSEAVSASGIYYAAFGLMGRQGPVGEMFLPEDVRTVLKEGHELGCHTYGHDNACQTMPAAFEASILKNRRALDELFPGERFRSLSYPYSFPRPGVKAKAGRYFDCCRSGGQTFNAGTADLNNLASFFLEQTSGRPQAAKDIIDETCRVEGWLILDTHDVCAKPSRFGCTTELFEEIVEYAVRSGAEILSVVDALQVLIERAGSHRGAVSS